MDSSTVQEIVEHSYAVAVWVLKWIDNHPKTIGDDFLNLEFHLERLNAITDELDAPLTRNPIVQEFRTTKRVRRKQKGYFTLAIVLLFLALPHYPLQANVIHVSSPNGLPHSYSPNINDALPYDR